MYYLCFDYKGKNNLGNSMKRTILFSLTLIIMATIAFGCCNCRKAQRSIRALIGTEWQLVQIMAHDVECEDGTYTLLFHDNGMVTGMGDCNHITATFATNAERKLLIENIGTTRRYCPNHEQENAFLDMLEAVTHYEMDGQIMLLLSNGTLVGMMEARPLNNKE